jgi:hypothetical protein
MKWKINTVWNHQPDVFFPMTYGGVPDSTWLSTNRLKQTDQRRK